MCRICNARDYDTTVPIHFPFTSASGEYTTEEYVVCKKCVEEHDGTLFVRQPEEEPTYAAYSYTITYHTGAPAVGFSLSDLETLCEDNDPIDSITVTRTGSKAWAEKDHTFNSLEEVETFVMSKMPQHVVPTEAWKEWERAGLKRRKLELK